MMRTLLLVFILGAYISAQSNDAAVPSLGDSIRSISVELVVDVCYGYASTDKLACSGNGKCVGPNNCQCRPNFIGLACSEPVVRNVVLDDLLDQFKAQVEILVSTERQKENDLKKDLESAIAAKQKLDEVEKKLADQFAIMNEEVKV